MSADPLSVEDRLETLLELARAGKAPPDVWFLVADEAERARAAAYLKGRRGNAGIEAVTAAEAERRAALARAAIDAADPIVGKGRPT